MKENADKARALDTAEIQKQLREQAEQRFKLRFQMSMGQAEGLKKYRLLRKERARMLTVLREREMNPDAAVVKPVKATAKAAAAPKKKAAAKTATKVVAQKAPAKAAVKNAGKPKQASRQALKPTPKQAKGKG
jgi:large subunit ribosomal protein L29